MKKTTRREFLKKSGFTMLTVGLSGQAFSRSLSMAANSMLTRAAAQSENDNILVIIQLAGGNDGLNNVIPLSGQNASRYKDFRNTLEIPEADILSLGADAGGNELGLHPSLGEVKNLFDQGRAAVIQSVGYENQNRSHFRSMDIWHTANPDRPEPTGWMGDYLDATFPSNDNPLLAVSLTGGRLPLSLRAEQTAVPAIGVLESYQLQTDPRFPGDANNRVEAFLALNQEGASDRVLFDQLGPTALEAYNSSLNLQQGIARYPEPAPEDNIVYTTNNGLAVAMQRAAKILAGDLGTKIVYLSLGGFDTHQTQDGFHATLLGYVSDAVDTFYRDMQRLGLDDKILMMTWSEFGRKVRENGNQGTDHGASSPQFVFGTPVKGGIYGQHPDLQRDLTNLDDTRNSIDFRSYYATVLENWLEVDSREILGDSFELLGFL